MLDLILNVANDDSRIRVVSMEGSRANPMAPKDQYQDYDITYYVTNIAPFYNNPSWAIKHFGKPLIMQMPEAMRRPSGGGHFNYMMLYPDGNRLDLTVMPGKPMYNNEPSVLLLDKDNSCGDFSAPDATIYHIKPPTTLDYYSCCNNFWWCLNNLAKGIVRDELSYTMAMLHMVVRPELHDMISWSIGVNHGFDRSVGKYGKYFKLYLSNEQYAKYAATYCGSDYNDMWTAVFAMCDLFHTMAIQVGTHFSLAYRQDEENGIKEYLKMMRDEPC